MKTLNLSFEQHPEAYTIEIDSGLLSSERAIVQHCDGERIFIISDTNVAPLYLHKLEAHFTDKRVAVSIVEAGESSKSFENYQKIISEMLTFGMKRNDLVVALGGGVVGDLAGYIAATYFRGISFIQIPTTILSQVDSSIGGKTAINHELGKNLIGAFHQPKAVLIDLDTLDTLPRREFSAGIAEIVKAALLNSSEFFYWIEDNSQAIIQKQPEILANMIEQSCLIKANIVVQDEKESGIRATLNLGHTFGHAIEKYLGFGALLHGEAVAVGMVLASLYAEQENSRIKDLAERLTQLLTRFGLPTNLRNVLAERQMLEKNSAVELVRLMQGDKKNLSDNITLILPETIGRVRIDSDQPANKVQAFLEQHLLSGH